MPKIIQPAIWLLIFIAALPQFSESVYTPALPSVSAFFNISEALAEYTLSIYLFGMGVGTLFWGRLSDVKGRRPCLLWGLLIFVLGCVGCFLARDIEYLMFSRFVQAFGGSTGSVLGQSIARDAFLGKERGKVFSLVGGAISFSPAIGPVLGGVLDEFFGWNYVFFLLGVCGIFVWSSSFLKLKETHHPKLIKRAFTVFDVFKNMITDPKIIACTLLVGCANGIGFSYYSEGPFFMIKNLGLQPKVYGSTFALIAVSAFSGSFYSKYLHSTVESLAIIQRGLKVSVLGTLFFLLCTWGYNVFQLDPLTMIISTVGSMMVILFGVAMATPNILAIALYDYEYATGTASSFLGFFYYIVTSLITYGMGLLHNGTLLPMPIYFLALSCTGLGVFSILLKKR